MTLTPSTRLGPFRMTSLLDPGAWGRSHSMETVLKKHRECFSWLVAIAVALLSQDVDAQMTVTQGNVSVARTRLQPGQSIDLGGEWLYRPGYLVQPDEQPQLAKTLHGYIAVPVPQLLNRTQWWLDDSEDFKKFEEARLEKLGFDTERAEDGWYQLQLDVPALPLGRRIFIEFDGVAMKSKAFLNGQLLGEHIGMFSRFASHVQPKLWTPSDPNLYRLDVTLESSSGGVLDQWTHNVGFRTFEARGNRFFLNGKPYWLRGANQLPYGKNSWDPALPRKLIQLMHDGNQRVTRTHATP